MRILTCGDLHADAYTAGLQRFADVERSLWGAARLAVEQGCAYFVQVGDLCDPGPQASRCAAVAIEVSAWLIVRGVRVRWLVGNHDVVEDGTGSSTLEPVAEFGRSLGDFGPASVKQCAVWSRPSIEWLDGDDVFVVALPHPARGFEYVPADYVRSIAPAAYAEARVVLVFGHLTVPGKVRGTESVEMARGREVLYPVAECVEKWGDSCVLVDGHYHASSRRAQGPVLVPGSVERLDKGEACNDSSVFILEV